MGELGRRVLLLSVLAAALVVPLFPTAWSGLATAQGGSPDDRPDSDVTPRTDQPDV